MIILITGASKGIGKYLLNKFRELDINTFGTFNNTVSKGDYSEYLTKVDITNPDEVKKWINEKTSLNDNYILINCAGINYNAFAHKVNLESWNQVINVNLIGTFNVIQAILPRMRELNYGRIINFSSIVAQKGIPGTSAYAASKSGLWGLTKCIAIENSKKNITINNLNLGYFDIGMISEVPENYLESIKAVIPTGSLGNPSNIFDAIQFIIKSEYTNGTSIDISAGLI